MFPCICCTPNRTFVYKKSLYRHQRKYESDYVDPLTRRQVDYDRNPRLCGSCDTPLSYGMITADANRKFCNRSCAAKKNNSITPKRKKSKLVRRVSARVYRVRTTGICKVCNSSTKLLRSKFCSVRCQQELKWRTRVEAFERNEIGFSPRQYRRYRSKGDVPRCDCCGMSEWLGQPIPLEVDHIDGDSNNSQIHNLRIICCNCHALTPTYKGKNRGKGRQTRMSRYYAGKSY